MNNQQPQDPDDTQDPMLPQEPTWSQVFDSELVGELSGVWGSASDDVFIVGGSVAKGEVYHFDGAAWKRMPIPDVLRLWSVLGFGPNDVFAVGERGAVIHFDGTAWTLLESGVTGALRGVWGTSSDDLWLVGGDVGAGNPILLRYNGDFFAPIPPPQNDRLATTLYGVWGSGGSVFAVGERGLIVEFRDGQWSQVQIGGDATEDFLAISGTGPDNVVAVGGRTQAQVAVFDGQGWSSRIYGDTPSLGTVFLRAASEAIVGGKTGFVATLDPASGSITPEDIGATFDVQAAWGDVGGQLYAVGELADFSFQGVALVRSSETRQPGPILPECQSDPDCPQDEKCMGGVCQSNGDSVVVGFLDGPAFVPIVDGGDMPLYRGFQGGSHFFVTLEFRGITAGTSADLTWRVYENSDGSLLSMETQTVSLFETSPGTFRVIELRVAFPTRNGSSLDGSEIDASFALTSVGEDGVLAAVTQTLVLKILQ